jgi:hypothetical protein
MMPGGGRGGKSFLNPSLPSLFLFSWCTVDLSVALLWTFHLSWDKQQVSLWTEDPIIYLTNCMEQSPWEAANALSWSRHQAIPRLLWNLKVHCSFHKNHLPLPILSQINPIYTLQPYFPVLISFAYVRLDLQSGLFPSGLPPKILYAFVTSMHPACATNLILLDLFHGNNIWWREQIMEFLIQFFPPSCRLIPLSK